MGMQFSVQDLLDLLSPERSVAPKVLQQKLAIEQAEAGEQLQLALDALEKVNLVEKTQGRYRLVFNDEIIAGRLRCSSKGFCFVTPDGPESEEIFVVEGGLKNAWNGDRVLVRLLKKASRRRKPEGEVVLVTERANSTLVGRLAVDDKLLMVLPLDDRLGNLLELVEAPKAELAADQIVEVQIVRYPLGRRPAKSRLLRVLGSANDPTVDLDLVASRYHLQFGFDPALVAVAAEAAALPPDSTGREDLRSLPLVCFAETGRDFALSLVREDTGWQLGLHTSDIAAFVAAGSPIDLEGYRRAFAAQLRGQPLPLWPAALGERAALLPGVDRESWSVIVTLDAQAQVRTYRWTRSLVQVRTQLDGLAEDHRQVAAALTAQGVAPLAAPNSPQIFVELLESLVGQHLAHLHLKGPFAWQAAPEGTEVLDWLRLGRACGLEVPEAEAPLELDGQHYRRWLEAAAAHPSGPTLVELLRATLPAAQLSAEPQPYFERNSTAVAPWARPLQRYADLLIQRLLVQVLTEGRDRKTPRSKVSVDLRASSCQGLIDWPVLKPKQQKDWEEAIPGWIAHLNTRSQQIRQALADLEGFERIGRLSTEGEPLRGLITGVQSYGFFVAVEEPFVEGLVHVSGLKDDWYTYQAREPALVGRRSRRRFQIGDLVKVKVKGIDYYRQQVDLMVVREEIEPSGGGEQPESPLLTAPES